MNILDISIAIILALSILRGIFTGLIRELSAIIGVAAGFYGAYTFYHPLAAKISGFVTIETSLMDMVSCFLIFCGIYVLTAVTGRILKYLLQIVFLGWMDRLTGAFFGFLKGTMIAAVVLITLTTFFPQKTDTIRGSALAPYVIVVSEMMVNIISREIKTDFNQKMAEIKKTWEKKLIKQEKKISPL